MKNTILKISVACSAIALFLGATTDLTYSYLMTHPTTLEKEFKRCQTADSSMDSCPSVKQAAEDFIKLISDRRESPQGFGKQIIKNQIMLADLEGQLNKFPKNSAEFLKVKESYDTQLQKVNTLLSVVAATSM